MWKDLITISAVLSAFGGVSAYLVKRVDRLDQDKVSNERCEHGMERLEKLADKINKNSITLARIEERVDFIAKQNGWSRDR